MNVYGAYALTALVGAAGSAVVALICISHFTTVTDPGMWAIVAMIGIPATMAVVVAGFIYLTSTESPRGNGSSGILAAKEPGGQQQ
jgi:hypothetical protein